MNKKSKLAIAISSTVLVGSLALGAVASAAGGGGNGGNGGNPVNPSGRPHLTTPHLTTQQKCDKAPQVEARVTTMKQRLDQRLTTLKDKKAHADAAGNTVRSQRIQQRIDRLTQAETRAEAKYAKFEAFVQANCGTTPTSGAPSAGA
jgi:hypothetical protein